MVRNKIPDGYKFTEVGVIPKDWDAIPIGKIVTDFRGGASFKPSDFKKSGVKVLPKKGVVRGGILQVEESELQYCSQEYADSHVRNQVDSNYTVVVLRDLVPSGPNIGLMVRIADKERYVLAQGVYGFIVQESNSTPGFLVQTSNTDWYRKVMNSTMVGSTQVHITNTAFKQAQIPLPPLPEQTAIATALSDVDNLITSLNKLIDKKRNIKQGTMQELLTGKKRLKGFKGEWEVKTFGDIVFIRKQKIDPRNVSNDTFCIGLENIQQSTGRLIENIVPSVGLSIKSVFLKGDILFGKLRAYLRKYWLADRDGICSTEIWAFVAKQGTLSSQYLFQLVQTDSFIEAASSSHGTHMPRTDWYVIKNYSIPLPPLPEQQAIAQILNDMDTEINQLEQRRDKYTSIKQGMMQQLLTGKIRLI